MTSIEFVLKTSFALLDNNERKKVSSEYDEKGLRVKRRKTRNVFTIFTKYVQHLRKGRTCLMWYYYIIFSVLPRYVSFNIKFLLK